MKLYVRPIFSSQHTLGSKVNRLGSSNLKFSNIEIILRNKNKITKKIIGIEDIEKLNLKEKEIIKVFLRNISKKRKSIAGLKFDKPNIMGILNVTPDSFFDGGNFSSLKSAEDQYLKMIREGADIIDIGGESTRPSSRTVTVKEELKRIIPVIKAIKKLRKRIPLSLDTRKPEVMLAGIKQGIKIINDVSGLRYSNKSISILNKKNIPVVIMHSISNPKSMQNKINYQDVLLDVYDFLEKKITECEKANINRSQIIIDPGIGFGKNTKQNLKLIENISLFHSLGVCILLGVSRKSFISKATKNNLVHKRLGGSIASVIYAMSQGVQIFRVHDVHETLQAVSIYKNISKI